jgi:hypothetical protein
MKKSWQNVTILQTQARGGDQNAKTDGFKLPALDHWKRPRSDLV